MNLNQSDYTKRIQSYLHDATQHIQGLKNLLEYAENKHNLSSHQKAYLQESNSTFPYLPSSFRKIQIEKTTLSVLVTVATQATLSSRLKVISTPGAPPFGPDVTRFPLSSNIEICPALEIINLFV